MDNMSRVSAAIANLNTELKEVTGNGLRGVILAQPAFYALMVEAKPAETDGKSFVVDGIRYELEAKTRAKKTPVVAQ